MIKKDGILIWLLCIVLIISITAGLFLDPSTKQALTPVGEYNIQITEICAKNETVTADNDGKYRDYIELYNAGEAVDLTGCTLTDGNVSSSPFDNFTMASGEYRVVFLSKDTTGFALSSSGRDSIQLKAPNGKTIAQTKVRSLEADQVMVLVNGAYRVSNNPSPSFANNSQGEKAFLKGTPSKTLSLRINEVLVANKSVLPDEKGTFSDIVELYNTTDTPVQLSGWSISDGKNDRFRYRLPDLTVPADSYVLIFCDGGNYVTQNGHIHANFSLSVGEALCLSDPNGNYVTLDVSYISDNISLAFVDGDYTAMIPSLNYPNTEEGCNQARADRVNSDSPLVISEVLTSDAGVPFNGQISDAVEICNRSNKTVSTSGWYLSDGSDAYAYPLTEKELKPGEYLTLTVSKQTTGFGLSTDETVYLMGPDHRIAHPVVCTEPPLSNSIGLLDLKDGDSYDFLPVSLGYTNDKDGAEAFAKSILTDDLQISELMSSNSSYLRGPYGNTADWIELYNAGKTKIDLSEYCLTDSSDLGKYPLPDVTLSPGKYIVILLDESGKNIRKGYSFLPFNLSAAGDRLYLTKDNVIVDFAILPELSGNQAWGRPKGKASFSLLASPTPESANSAAAKISASPTAELPQGAYDKVNTLSISFSAPGEIYYTTDCTVPTRSSKRYTGPIVISRTTVFRVAAYEPGAERSEVVDLTYLVNEGDTLSTVCLVTTPKNLWDYYSGIYVEGPDIKEKYPYKGANYWKDWEKNASVALFEEDGTLGFYEPCGLKIYGGYSRVNGKKSLACMFRGKYGASSLNYSLFGDKGIDEYQSFVLRAGGQDAYGSKIRDEMITSLAYDYLGIPVQQYRAVILYLNGEYWGIYFIREKLTDQYVAANFNVNADDVTIANWTGVLSSKYTALQNYARSNDLTKKTHYDYVLSQINEDNYIDNVITQMWIGNTDLGNVKFFCTDELEWHWALFDTDMAFKNVAINTTGMNLRKSDIWSRDIMSRVLIVKLLKNTEFRDKFIRRIAYQVNTVWNERTVVERIDEFQALLQADMAKECDRWGGSVSSWENKIEKLRDFARKRNDYFIPDIQEFFGLNDQQMKDYGFEV